MSVRYQSLKQLIFFLLLIYFFLLFNNKLFEFSLNFKVNLNLWQIRIPDFIYLILLTLLLFNNFKLSIFLNRKVHLSFLLICLIFIHSFIIKLISNEYILPFDSIARLISYIVLAYLISIQFNKEEFKKLFIIFCIIFLFFNTIQYLYTFLEYAYSSLKIRNYHNTNLNYLIESGHSNNHEIKKKINYYYFLNTQFLHHFMSFAPFERVFKFTEINLFNFVLIIFFLNFNKFIFFSSSIFLLICRSVTVFILFYYEIVKRIKNIYLIFLIFIISFILLYLFRDFSSIFKPRIFLIYKYSFFIYERPFLGVGLNNFLNFSFHEDVWQKIFYVNDNKFTEYLNYFLNNFGSTYSNSYIFNFYDHEIRSIPPLINSPHNAILQIYVEYGVFFGSAILYLMIQIYKIEKNKEILIILYFFFLNSFFPGNPETLILFIFLFLEPRIKNYI